MEAQGLSGGRPADSRCIDFVETARQQERSTFQQKGKRAKMVFA